MYYAIGRYLPQKNRGFSNPVTLQLSIWHDIKVVSIHSVMERLHVSVTNELSARNIIWAFVMLRACFFPLHCHPTRSMFLDLSIWSSIGTYCRHVLETSVDGRCGHSSGNITAITLLGQGPYVFCLLIALSTTNYVRLRAPRGHFVIVCQQFNIHAHRCHLYLHHSS